MSYRLIDANAIAVFLPEVNDMPCIYADLPRGLDDGHYDMREPNELQCENVKLQELVRDMMWTIRHAHGYFENDTHEMLMTYVRGCDGKPTHVAYSLTSDEKRYERRMRELGVEVEK